MVDHVYWDLGSRAGGACFEVELRGSPARVCLLTGADYESYVDEDPYEYYGGFTDHTPVLLEVPHDGQWMLVIDSYTGTITATVTEAFD